jgi:hypothetical protein
MSNEKPLGVVTIINTPGHRYSKTLKTERLIAQLLQHGHKAISTNEDADRRAPRRILLDRSRRDNQR